ncbi:hypothetical protein EBZ37_15315 [bacterium]|nr:hypothetical protein [bacterium]
MPCRSVVTLSPAHAQIILDLLGQSEAKKILVGAASYSPLPKDFNVPEVASVGRLDIERILSARPDCVFQSPGVFPVAAIERLERVIRESGGRIRLLKVSMDSLKDIAESYRSFGRILDVADRGSALARDFETQLQGLKGKLSGVRVLIQVDENPMIVVGGGKSFLSEAFQHLGVTNVYSSVREAYPRVSLESAIAVNPDQIWILGESEHQERYEGMAAAWRRRFPKIKAVKDSKVRVILSKDLTLPTRSILQGLQRVVNHETQ